MWPHSLAKYLGSGSAVSCKSLAVARAPFRLSLPSVLAGIALFSAQSATAVTYRVTFEGVWVANQVDPGTYPGSAHFSPMVGSTHQPGEAFWVPGGLASNGVEDVAEVGVVTDLESEIQTAIAAGMANNYLQVSPNLFNLPNSSSTTFTTDSGFPEVSLISMVAPSPDWFVGVYNEPLMEAGQWKPDFSVDLVAWDAGTENGSGFSINNSATNPAQPIALVTEAASPFIGQPIIGNVRFELVADPALSDLNERGVQISHVQFDTQVVTLKNFGGVEEPLDGWRFCTHDEDSVRRYSGSTGLNGVTLAPGETLDIHFLNDAIDASDINISTIGGAFATPLDQDAYGMQIYFDPVSFGNGNTIADHLQWSLDGIDDVSADERSDEAEAGGVWVDQTNWIATTAQTISIALDDTSGASLHSPINYSTEEPQQPESVNVPLLPLAGLGVLAGLLVALRRAASLNR